MGAEGRGSRRCGRDRDRCGRRCRARRRRPGRRRPRTQPRRRAGRRHLEDVGAVVGHRDPGAAAAKGAGGQARPRRSGEGRSGPHGRDARRDLVLGHGIARVPLEPDRRAAARRQPGTRHVPGDHLPQPRDLRRDDRLVGVEAALPAAAPERAPAEDGDRHTEQPVVPERTRRGGRRGGRRARPPLPGQGDRAGRAGGRARCLTRRRRCRAPERLQGRLRARQGGRRQGRQRKDRRRRVRRAVPRRSERAIPRRRRLVPGPTEGRGLPDHDRRVDAARDRRRHGVPLTAAPGQGLGRAGGRAGRGEELPAPQAARLRRAVLLGAGPGRPAGARLGGVRATLRGRRSITRSTSR